jgi:hypothetical protein
MMRTRRFHTEANDRFFVRYNPASVRKASLPGFFELCESERQDLAARFGFDISGRVLVYLFAFSSEIGEIFGKEYVGLAFWPGNTIVVPEDRVKEVLRHELAHLFAAKWSPWTAPLLQEGLATHLQGKVDGRGVDFRAFPHSLSRELRMRKLLQESFFFGRPETEACYVLAGSFTGFLIRRWGWEMYGTYYRKANRRNYHQLFVKCFGITLVQAEWQWRDELMKSMVPDFQMRRKLIAGWDPKIIAEIF